MYLKHWASTFCLRHCLQRDTNLRKRYPTLSSQKAEKWLIFYFKAKESINLENKLTNPTRLYRQCFLLTPHLPQLFEIRLISHKNHRCIIGTSDSINKLFKLPNFMETSTIRDGIADDEAFSCSHVLISHGCKLCLQKQGRVSRHNTKPRAHQLFVSVTGQRCGLPALLSQNAWKIKR